MTGECGGLVGSKDNRGIEGEADAEGGGAVAEELVEVGAAQAEAGEVGEVGGDAGIGVGESDSGEGEAFGIGEDAEGGEGAARFGQESFAAGLVDGGMAGVGKEDVGAAEAEGDGGGEASGSGSGDEYVAVMVTHVSSESDVSSQRSVSVWHLAFGVPRSENYSPQRAYLQKRLRHHSRRSISELKPGPMAARMLLVPGAGRRCFMISSRTTRTEAEERLPTRRRTSQETSRSSRERPRACCGGFEDFGAAGMHDPGADVVAGEVVRGEEVVDVGAEVFNDDFGDVGGEDDVEAFFRDGPTHDVFGVGVEDAIGGEDARAAKGDVFATALSPATRTAAAPSPKRPTEMRLATDLSSRCQVREQSSTESRTATWSGYART